MASLGTDSECVASRLPGFSYFEPEGRSRKFFSLATFSTAVVVTFAYAFTARCLLRLGVTARAPIETRQEKRLDGVERPLACGQFRDDNASQGRIEDTRPEMPASVEVAAQPLHGSENGELVRRPGPEPGPDPFDLRAGQEGHGANRAGG